tara:strand:- start:87 stop:575 length:489 start_codon:yes stop_codon:yes gene_type:complete
MFGKISGAHFNPIVTMIFYLKKEINLEESIKYILIQIISGLFAIIAVHFIFEQSIIQISQKVRGEWPLLISEIIATLGLILTILLIRKNDEDSVAIGVALFITAGYWFTSSTSFANPAVTIARMFTNTFTGISPISTPYFIFGQIIGAIIGLKIFNFLNNKE